MYTRIVILKETWRYLSWTEQCQQLKKKLVMNTRLVILLSKPLINQHNSADSTHIFPLRKSWGTSALRLLSNEVPRLTDRNNRSNISVRRFLRTITMLLDSNVYPKTGSLVCSCVLSLMCNRNLVLGPTFYTITGKFWQK